MPEQLVAGPPEPGRRRWSEVGWYAAAVVLSLLLTVGALRLWRAHPRVPLTYQGDTLFLALWVKGATENGWYLHNDAVGAPHGSDAHDFPAADSLHVAALMLLHRLTGSVSTALNVYFLLTFPLSAVSALFALRRLGLGAPAALLAALLFALQPYHFLRGELHLCLSSYYLVPLGLLLALGLLAGRDGTVRPLGWPAALAVCVLMSSAGVYYAFFTGFFLSAAGLLALVRTGSWRPFGSGLLLSGVMVGGLVLNVLPTLRYWSQHGPNPAIRRHVSEAEVYALKPSQLVLPVNEHRSPTLAQLKNTYNSLMPLVNENSWAALGAVGAVGFLGLIGWLLVRPLRPSAAAPLPDSLSLLNLLGLLLGTVGGIGTLFNLLVAPWIRAYNRVSIFLAFLALAFVAWALDRLAQRFLSTAPRRLLYVAGLGALLLGGVWDQTTQTIIPAHPHIRHQYRDDARFVRGIEQRLGPGAMVFQLPIVRFPENPPVHGMLDYDHLRGYLHSRHLRWSYGCVKGRAGDEWQQSLAQAPTPELLDIICLAGFRGLYINRRGFNDGGGQLLDEVDRLLGHPQPHVNGDGTLVFYDLTAHAERLRQQLGEYGWDEAAKAALMPPRIHWGESFSPPEGPPGQEWRWCGPEGELCVENPTPFPVRVALALRIRTANPAPAHLELTGLGVSERQTVAPSGEAGLRVSFVVPPGRHPLRLTCDASVVTVPDDPRQLVFRVEGFHHTWEGLLLRAEARQQDD